MRILLLSEQPISPTAAGIAAAATARGHTVAVLHPEHVLLRPDGSGPVPDADVALNRMLGHETDLAHARRVGATMERAGMPVVNTTDAVWDASHKSVLAERFHSAAVPQVPTWLLSARAPADAVLDRVPLPLVVKGDRGFGGVAVHLVATVDELAAALAAGGGQLVAQPFVPEAARTIRAVVIGSRVVAAMVRTAPAGDWRANVAVGATAEPVELTGDERRIAVAATRSVGLEIAGVDLVRTADGTVVLELNPAPGLAGTNQACGRDVCADIVDHLEVRATTP